MRGAARPGRLPPAGRTDRRPRGGAHPRHRPEPTTRLARVQLRWSRRRRAPRPCPASPRDVPAAVRARYDLVSFDPRGTGSSRPVECVDDATADRLNVVDPDPQLRCGAAVVLRRHARTGRPRGALRRPQRRVAGPARQPERGPRHRPAPHRARRRPAVVHRVLLRDGHRRGLRADVPRSGRAHGARLARRPLGERARRAARQRAGLRAGARRLPGRLRRQATRARSTTAATPSAALAKLKTRFEQGLQLPTDEPDTGKQDVAHGRGRRVLHRADLRALRQAVRLAVPRATPSPTPSTATAPCCSTSPTRTTGAATTAATTTSTRSSASSSATTGSTRPRPSTTTAPSTTASVAEYPLLGGYVGSTVLGLRPPAAAARRTARAARRRARLGHRADPDRRHDARPGHAVRRRARTSRHAHRRLTPAHVREHRAHRVHEEPLHQRRGRRLSRCAARCRPTAPPVARSPARGQLDRGTSFHGTSRDASGSFGSPSTRSPRMLRMIADVPPSIVLACARRNPRATRARVVGRGPRRS